MRPPLSSPQQQDPHYPLPSPSVMPGTWYWPPPPGYPPTFWSPHRPPTPYYGPHYPHLPPPPKSYHFGDIPAAPSSGHCGCSSSCPRPPVQFVPVVLSAPKQPRKKPSRTNKHAATQKIVQRSLNRRLLNRSPLSESTPKSPCASGSTVSSSNVPLNVLKTKLHQIRRANRKTLGKTRLFKREVQMETSLCSVSKPKTPYASDSMMSSSNVPLNVLKTKLSQIRSEKRKTLEKTVCVGDSETMASNASLNLFVSKMIQTRKAKRKARLVTSASKTIVEQVQQVDQTAAQTKKDAPSGGDLECPTETDDLVDEMLQYNLHLLEIASMGGTFVEQNKEGPKGKTNVEQVQQVDQMAQTNALSGGDSEGPTATATDDIVAEMLQHNLHLSETTFMPVLIADTEKMVVSPHLDEIMNEFVTRESDREVDRRDTSQYSVDSSLRPLLDVIINKYGDIAKDCIHESNSVRSSLLEQICKVFQGMDVKAKDLDLLTFNNYYQTLKNADESGVDVKWLLERLDKLLAISHMAGKCKDLGDANKKNLEMRKSIKVAAEAKKSEVKGLELEVQELENQLDSEIHKLKEMETKMAAFGSKVKFFRDEGLMGGLL